MQVANKHEMLSVTSPRGPFKPRRRSLRTTRPAHSAFGSGKQQVLAGTGEVRALAHRGQDHELEVPLQKTSGQLPPRLGRAHRGVLYSPSPFAAGARTLRVTEFAHRASRR